MFKKQYVLERREALALLEPINGKMDVYRQSGRSIIRNLLTTKEVIYEIVDGRRLELTESIVYNDLNSPTAPKQYYLTIDRTVHVDVNQKKAGTLKTVMDKGGI